MSDAKVNGELGSELQNNPTYKSLVGKGYKERVAMDLTSLFDSGMLKENDLDERTMESLRTLNPDHTAAIIKQFRNADLTGISNKAACFGTCVKVFRERSRQMGVQAALDAPLLQGPDPEKLKTLLDRTGYPVDVTIGQRKYGPPPGTESESYPGPGCEIYIGRIPPNVYEDELVPVFEKCGKIWDLRIMMNPLTSQSKGYAFLTYANREAAKEAEKTLDGHEIKTGRKLRVNVSVANTRIFVGNIPKNKSREDVKEEFSQLTDGLVDVIVYTTPDDTERKKNRGFAFLQFEDHRAASAAKRRLTTSRQKPWGRDIMIDWAEPLEEPDEDTMSKVKILYVKNLKGDVSEDQVKTEFEKFGGIERVKRQKDYAFVHFAERDDAVKAMESLQGHEFGGVACEICLAKPQMDKQKKQQMMRERDRRQMSMLMRSGLAFDYGAPPRGALGFRGRPQQGPPVGMEFEYGLPAYEQFYPGGAGPMGNYGYNEEWAYAGGGAWANDSFGFDPYGYGAYGTPFGAPPRGRGIRASAGGRGNRGGGGGIRGGR